MALRVLLIAMLSAATPLLGAEASRSSLVLHKGQRYNHAASAEILTVQAPSSLRSATEKMVEVRFDQYGRNLLLTALREGYTKLLIERTDSTVGEILHLVITDEATATRYRRAVSELSGIDGIDESSIFVAGKDILIGGLVYSVRDLRRCLDLASSLTSSKGIVACGARLSSAAPVADLDRGYLARANITFAEEAARITGGETEGLEEASRWTLTAGLADVPVLLLQSEERATIVSTGAGFVDRLNRAISEWETQGSRRGVYFPSTFNLTSTRTGEYELRMQWKFDQGTRGELVARINPELLRSLQGAGAPERLTRWSAAILQDAFRLYFLGQRPSATLNDRGESPLLRLYEHAVALHRELAREEAERDIARAWFALYAAAGDPLSSILRQLPPSFAAESGARP